MRRIGFEEAEEIFAHAHYEDRRSDDPEQFRAISWVNPLEVNQGGADAV